MWLLKYEVFDNHNSKHFHRLIFSYLLSTYISSEVFFGGKLQPCLMHPQLYILGHTVLSINLGLGI